MADLVSVKRSPDDEDYVPPIPEVVIQFRRSINALKGSILDSLASDGKQDAKYYTNAINRIKQLGNSLKVILRITDPDEDRAEQTGGNMKDIKHFFEENGVEFEALTPEERGLCITYVNIDIDMYPDDRSLAHINSQTKYRKSHNHER